ncbi:hypothetical protein [Vallitalea okinawensis]|uniref:hypothetical protein n=1 Tax=Vallitalea okinawensis TaxID=2078660 RepID=UPI000CFB824A|nr:hypothetical protein [Vallitalea okinawensis]
MICSIQKKGKILYILIVLFLFTACNRFIIQETGNDIDNTQALKIQELSNEVELLRASNQELVSKNIALRNELESIKEEKLEYELKISEQEQKAKETEQEANVDIKRISVEDLHLDGEPLWNYKDYSAFRVDEQLYIPTQLLSDYYNLSNDNGYNHVDNIVIKGRPIEKKVFKVGKVIRFDTLGEILGEKEFDEAQKVEETTVFDLDGIIFEVDERFIVYTITSHNYMTENGITIGASKEEVRQVYGDIGDMNEDEWFTCKTSADVRRIYFTFVDNKVSAITQRIR